MSVLPSQQQAKEPQAAAHGAGADSSSAANRASGTGSPAGGCCAGATAGASQCRGGLAGAVCRVGRFIRSVIYWCWWLFVYLAITLEIGALIGAFLFATVGALSHPQLDLMRRIEIGLADGFLYAGVWAGGMAIVLCFMRGHRRNEARRREAARAAEVGGACCGGRS